jgi:hypothetical protein
MKTLNKSFAFILAATLFLTGCGSTTPIPVVTPPPVTPVVVPPTPLVPPQPNNLVTDIQSGCALYNTLGFLIPIATNLVTFGKLSAQGQLYLTDAENAISAGCNTNNTSAMMIAAAAAEELVSEIWGISVPVGLPPPAAHTIGLRRTVKYN